MIIFLHSLSHLIWGALPVLYPEILDEFELSYVQLGFLQTITLFASGFPQIFVGYLRKWFSGRTLIGFGNAINAFFNIIASFVGGFWQFLSCRLLAGLGGSTQHPVGTSVLTTNTDPSWRGRIFGLNLAVPMLASTLAPILAAGLMVNVGWRTTLFIIALPALITSALMLIFVEEKAEAASRERIFSFRSLLRALRNRNVMAISTLRSLMAFRMGVRAFIPLYLIEMLSMSVGLSSTLYSLMIFGGVVGPFFWGYLSDRMQRKPIIMVILSLQCILFYGLNLVSDTQPLSIMLFLIGFMAQTVVMQSMLADSITKEHLDQIFGFYYTLGFTLGSASSITFAYIVETFGFNQGFTYIAAVTAVSLIPAFFIKETRGTASNM